MQKIPKQLNKSNGDYKGTAAQKLPSNRSDKKRIPKFIGEILVMIHNDPNKSIRSIAKDMRISEFLISQIVHEEIQYFSNQMREGRFYFRPWKTRGKTPLLSVWTNSSIPPNAEPYIKCLLKGIWPCSKRVSAGLSYVRQMGSVSYQQKQEYTVLVVRNFLWSYRL